MSRQLDSVRRFLAQQRSPGPRPEEGVAIVAGSGKGGTGTSSIVALLGLAAADAGREVLLVDANENVGTLHLLLGVNAVERTRAELEERMAELKAWEDISRGADFPAG